MTLTVWTNAQILAQLGSGHYWAGPTITYAFPTTGLNLNDAATATGFTAFNATQQSFATLAITLWDDLIAPSLVLTAANNTNLAPTTTNIEIAFSTNSAMGGGYAYTYFPVAGAGPGADNGGTAWFNNYYNGDGTDGTGLPGPTHLDPFNSVGNDLVHPAIGKHGFATYIHELGHAFGLDHAGNYNAGVGVPEPTNYQDSTVYSIMSYFGPSWGDGADSTPGRGGALYSTEVAWATWDPGYDPQTPMLNDIMAMQAAYGASTTTRTGNTVYGFNSTITGIEAPIYDFSINQHPILCIYDSTGIDTIDLSGYSTASKIDLNPGAFSDAKGMTKNISIAYSAIIENAVGGSGADTLIGNGVDNVLNGGGGIDNISGAAGDDTLIGGSGADILDGGTNTAIGDTASYAGSAGVTVDLRIVGAQISSGDASGDVLSNIENLIGSSNADTLTGNASANILDGGLGDDTLVGGAGADRLVGGGGVDTASYAGSATGVQVSLLLIAPQVSTGDASGDILTAIANLTGSSNADTLTGNGSANILNGGLGDDLLIGGAGADQLIGGGGVDTASYASSAVGVQVSLLVAGAQVSTGDASGDILVGISSLIGSALDDTLLGNSNSNTINAGAGNNYIDGNGGNDFILAGGGSDTIVFHAGLLSANVNAGLGTDTLSIVDGTLPTGFNLVASSIENATWLQHDTTNQAWDHITSNFNSAWQLLDQTTVNDNLSTSTTTYDPTNLNNVWSSVRNDYDALSHQTLNVTVYDSGTSIYTYYDPVDALHPTGTQIWSSIRYDYNAASQWTQQVTTNDNGTASYTYYDPTDALHPTGVQNWSSIRYDYNTALQWTLQVTALDNGTTSYTYYDPTDALHPTGAQVYSSVRYDYDANSHLTLYVLALDNGTTNYIYYDPVDALHPTGAATWANIAYTYDINSHLIESRTTQDTNFVNDIIYDANNAFPTWNEWHRNYDDHGVLIQEFYI